MRRFAVGIACLVVSLAAPSASLRADDEKAAGHGGEKHEPVKIIVQGPFEGGVKEKSLDLSVPKDRAEFMRDLDNGRIHELEQVRPSEIIPKHFDLGLWSIIIFLALFFVLKKFAWKPMLEGLHKREENIRGALDQAEKTRQEAMQLQAKLDAQLKEAGGKIAAMMDDARRDAQGIKDQMVSAAQKEIQEKGDKLKREMEMAKDQALQEIWQQAVTLASLMSTKAVRRSLSPDDHKRLLDESLAELKQAGTGFAKRSLSGSGL